MHDPMVVAFEIRRPWPRRERSRRKPTKRWEFSGAFWTLAGRRFYWPAVVVVWHKEPGGRGSGEVCKHYRRWQVEPGGKWETKILHGWKWHVHHWHVQVPPVQGFRRWLLTRCAWCGGRQRRRDAVNVSHQWDGSPSPWWRGEVGLFHHDCSSVAHAHRKCYCPEPALNHEGYGQCQTCGKFLAYRETPDDADWLLRRLPTGSRAPASLRPELEAAWARRRAVKEGVRS